MSNVKINDKFHIYTQPVNREKTEYMVELYEDNELIVCDLVPDYNLSHKIDIYKSNYKKYSKKEKEKNNVII